VKEQYEKHEKIVWRALFSLLPQKGKIKEKKERNDRER
jgi:hypothetical protein